MSPASTKPCQVCGHQIAFNAKACPSCGARGHAQMTRSQLRVAYGVAALVMGGLALAVHFGRRSEAGPVGSASGGGCESVPASIVEGIRTSPQDGQPDLVVIDSSMVRSLTRSNLYYIALRLSDAETGVWATPIHDGQMGLMVAADATAKALTILPDGSTFGALDVQATDPEVTAANDCLP